MNYCLEQRFMTVEQISRRFFRPGEGVKYPLHTAYRRALTLQKFGMIKLVPIITGHKVAQTTELGAGQLDGHGLDRLPIATQDFRTFEHDRRVTDVRIIFEELGLISSWTSDRQLKSQLVNVRRVPDAIFTLKRGHVVALEVEIARKGKERYRRIFGDYLERRFGDIEILFYVCNTLRQLEGLAELTREYRWVYYAMYEQLIRNEADTVFANKRDDFRLRELGKYDDSRD